MPLKELTGKLSFRVLLLIV